MSDNVDNSGTISPLARLAAAAGNPAQALWNWGGVVGAPSMADLYHWGGVAGLPSLYNLITGDMGQSPMKISAANAPQFGPDATIPVAPSPPAGTQYVQGATGTQSGAAARDPNAIPPAKPGTPLSSNTAGMRGMFGTQSGTAYGSPDRPYSPFSRDPSATRPDIVAVPQPKMPPPKPKTLPPPAPQGDQTVASVPGQPGVKPINPASWGQPDEQTQAVNKALDIIANMKAPTLQKLQDLPRPPTRETQNSWMSTILSSAGLFLAMMGSRRSAAPMTAAIKSFGGYLDGYSQGQQIVWKQKEVEYQDQLNYAIKQNELELEQYKADLEANKDKLDMLHESLYATSLLNEDKKLQMELENGHIEIALKMIQARSEALKQVQTQAMNVIYGKIYAGLPVTQEDIAALTAEPDLGGMFSTGSSEHPSPNNVGNLKAKGGAPGWQTFDTPQDGAAAMINTLRGYGPVTLAQAITKYAPPSENNTQEYIQKVSQALKMDPNAPLPVDDPDAMAHIAYVMSTLGEGKQVQPEVFTTGTKIAYQGKPLDGQTQKLDGQPQPASATSEQPTSVGGMTQDQITDMATTYLERGELPNLGTGGDKMLSAMNFQTRQAVIKRATELSGEVTRVAQDTSLSPDQKMAWVQKNIPRMAPVVQGLIDGSIDLPASRTMSTPFWDNAFSLAESMDPSFSKSLYSQRRATVLAFSGSGQIRRGLNSASNMIKLADQTIGSIKSANLSRFPTANALQNWLATQEGKSTITNLRLNFSDLAQEAVKVIRAGSGNESDIQRIIGAIDPATASPEQLISAVQNIVRTAWYQVEDWQNQYQTDMGKPYDLSRALGKSVTDARDRIMSVDPAEQDTSSPKKNLPNVYWNPQRQRWE